MTLDELMAEAAKVALAERRRYRIEPYDDEFSVWENDPYRDGHDCDLLVCEEKPEAECQEWIERRILKTVFRWMVGHVGECDQLLDLMMEESRASFQRLVNSGMGETGREGAHRSHGDVTAALFKALAGEVTT